MAVHTEPDKLPDETYHTLRIEKMEDGDFHLAASNNDNFVSIIVGSVGLGGESVGVIDGSMAFDAAAATIKLNYEDFTDEHGYDEIQVVFEER